MGLFDFLICSSWALICKFSLWYCTSYYIWTFSILFSILCCFHFDLRWVTEDPFISMASILMVVAWNDPDVQARLVVVWWASTSFSMDFWIGLEREGNSWQINCSLINLIYIHKYTSLLFKYYLMFLLCFSCCFNNFYWFSFSFKF